MQTVLITGGTGLVGKALTKQLTDKGYAVIILTRKMPTGATKVDKISYALWDIKQQTIDSAVVQKASFIIHLAGAGVMDKRWTAAYKKEILDSRTQSSELLVKVLQENTNQVKAIICASAIGWYGADKKTSANKNGFIENAEPSSDFLGDTCRLWEKSMEPVIAIGIRLVKLRTGIVLSNNGGALAEFKKPLRFGVAGILGDGKQVTSWIHIEDLCRMYIAAIENENLAGAYNAVAPMPVTNKELTLLLAKNVKGNYFIPLHVPEFMLKLVLGESSIEILKSTTVSCEKIKQAGFTFLYPSIHAALGELGIQ